MKENKEVDKIYYRINDDEKEKIQEVCKITGVDYEILGDFASIDSLIWMIKDLVYEIHKYQEIEEDEESTKECYEYDAYQDRMLEEEYKRNI